MLIIPLYILYYWIVIKYFSLVFIKKNLKPCKKYIRLVFILTLQLFFLGQLKNPIILFLCNNMLLIALCMFWFRTTLKQSITFSFLGCSTAMLVEIATAILLNLYHYSSDIYILAGNIISKIILLTMIHLLSLYKNKQFYTTITGRLCLLLVASTLSCLFITYFTYVLFQSDSTIQNKAVSIILLLALSTLNIAYYVIEDRLSHASILMAQNLLLAKQLNHYESISVASEYREKAFAQERHNLKNQLLAIRAYAMQNNNPQIIEFINTLLSDRTYGISKITYCNNILLDTLLSAKNKIAEKYNIEYIVDIDVPSVLPFDNIDLCNLIGNALDNCFDACIQDSQNHNVYVHVTLRLHNNCLFCNFTNSCFHNLNQTAKGLFFSTKSSQHGYGLSSIKEIVSLYDGIIDFQKRKNAFSLKAILYPQCSK